MTIQSQLDALFRQAIRAAFGLDADPLVGYSTNESFADYQCNAAMGLAKRIEPKTNPRAIAEKIKASIDLSDIAAEITIAGPGFINIRLKPDWLAAGLNRISQDDRLGVDKAGHPQTVVVDYSGPNIAKEMHVGHLRSTIIGDAISRLLEFRGHTIIRQNHIGDWGTQFGRVVLAMWYRIESDANHLGAEFDAIVAEFAAAKDPQKDQIVQRLGDLHQRLLNSDPEGNVFFEPGLAKFQIELPALEALYQFVSAAVEVPAARTTLIHHPTHGSRPLADIPRMNTTFIQNPKNPENKQEKLAWQKAREVTLRTCEQIYQRLDVKLKPSDVRGESEYQNDLAGIVADLKQNKVATDSEGAVIVQVPGYESPLMIQKSDGGYLYGTTDLAAIRYRIQHLHANRIIYTHDSRQQQHFAQVFWTAQQAGWATNVSLDYAPFGTMLGEDGKPFKTRSGGTVKLKELLDEAEQRARRVVDEKNPDLQNKDKIAHAIGIGAVKYADLAKDRISDYVFSFDKILALDGNTAPYLQYAHARIRSIRRKAGESKQGPIALTAPHELALGKHLARLGEILDVCVRELKPHHLCAYLYELAVRFSGFYENCPVIQSEEPTRSSRLALCDLTARTMEIGLDLLGIEHPEQM